MKRPGLLIGIFGSFLFVQAAQADWTPAKRITWTSGMSINSDMAIDSTNTIHVVWEDDTPGNREIYCRRSTDGGTTWIAAKRLTWTSGESIGAAIAVDSDNHIHVVWYDDTPGNHEIYYRKGLDGGTTWDAAKRLTWTSGESSFPQLAIDSSGNLQVLWKDNTSGNYEIYHKSSTDGGTTWSGAQRLTWTSITLEPPAMGIDSGNIIHVAWADLTSGNIEIYYGNSEDGGATWSAAKRLTWTSGSSYHPAIAIDSGNTIHVVWNDDTPSNAEIFHKSSADGGTTWSDARRLTWTTGKSGFPAIAIDAGDSLHVVWQDDTQVNQEIYYKRSADGGTTWSGAQRLTWTTGASWVPSLARDANDLIHITWDDLTPGNYEIYYKNGH